MPGPYDETNSAGLPARAPTPGIENPNPCTKATS